MDDFKSTAEEALTWAQAYLERGYEGPISPQVQPGDIARKIPECAPLTGESLKTIYEDFQKTILPGLVHQNDPRWVAYFPVNNSKPSVLACLLMATLNVNAMSWNTGPAATELELKMMQWLGQMIGLDWPGVTQDTASTSTLVALLAAREAKYPVNQEGFYSAPKLSVYASVDAHSSILKGAFIAGLGQKYFRSIPVKADRSMDEALLERALEEDRKQGIVPCFIAATVGTTSTTAVDPVSKIAVLGKKYGAWVHVDAALAGSAAILPEMSWLMDGVKDCDSFLFNPHKWLFTNFDCSAFFTKHPEKIKQALSISPEYLKWNQDSKVENLRDWGIQLGRSFRGLKLWFVLRAFGVEGLREKIREHLSMAQAMARKIQGSPHLKLFEVPRLNTVCFSMATNEKTQILLDKLNASGEIFLSHTKLDDRLILRVALGQTLSSMADVEKLFGLIESHAQKI